MSATRPMIQRAATIAFPGAKGPVKQTPRIQKAIINQKRMFIVQTKIFPARQFLGLFLNISNIVSSFVQR